MTILIDIKFDFRIDTPNGKDPDTINYKKSEVLIQNRNEQTLRYYIEVNHEV